MKLSIRRIGNSQGVVIPKSLLKQSQMDEREEVEVRVGVGEIILRKPEPMPREGWAEAARALREAGEDELVWSEFRNEVDKDLVW